MSFSTYTIIESIKNDSPFVKSLLFEVFEVKKSLTGMKNIVN